MVTQKRAPFHWHNPFSSNPAYLSRLQKPERMVSHETDHALNTFNFLAIQKAKPMDTDSKLWHHELTSILIVSRRPPMATSFRSASNGSDMVPARSAPGSVQERWEAAGSAADASERQPTQPGEIGN